MINGILNAYEETRRQNEGDIFKSLKRAGIGVQIYLIFLLICEFTMYVTLAMNQKKVFLCTLVALFIASQIWYVLDRKRNQKKWDENMHKYHDRLDIIKEVLSKPEFNMYEKNKLKQLICKYKADIDNLKKKNLDIKQNYNNFCGGYIVPVIAFGAGKLSQEMTGEDLFVMCLGVIAFLVLIKVIVDNIWIMRTEFIEGNEIERKQDFLQKLQDLLDRDFSIEEGDLL